MYYFLETLGSAETETKEIHPSEVIPKNLPTITDKEKFREWCVDPKTKHCFLTLAEGLNPHQRISGSNPAHKLWGFVGDYDGENLIAESMESIVAQVKSKSPSSWLPTWICRTFSGKIRILWEFEDGIMIDDEKLCEKIMLSLTSLTKCKSLLKSGGWDECSQNPAMMYEIGSSWERISDSKISSLILQSMFFDAAKQTSGPRGKVTIPLDIVEEKVKESFPGRWVGEFDIGRRGPLFWVEDGVDRAGAIVQEGGMWCYSTRGGKSFFSWADIFGEKFVAEFRDQQLAEAIEDTWFDGKKYWVKDGRNAWSPVLKEDLMARLRLAGFSHKSRKQNDPASQIDEVIVYIQDQRRIHGAAPFLFDYDEIVEKGPHRYINTHANLKPMQPAASGDPALWPNLNTWFHNFLDDHGSTDYLLAWLQRFYVGSLKGDPDMGHSLIIAGYPDKGKSLFSTFLLPKIFNGGADSGSYLMGLEGFNQDLTQSPVWYIDDNASGATQSEHRRFSEMLKKLSATPKVTARVMYSDPVDIPRVGRIILTTNTDADSLAVIPNLDGNILDKLMIFKMSKSHIPWFLQLAQTEIENTIETELPYFLAWLLNTYEPPAHVVKGASGRYGVHAYHHAEIVSMAKDLSPDMRDWEMIQFWWSLSDQEAWEGNVSAFMGELEAFEPLRVFTRTMNKVSFGRTMAKLSSTYQQITKNVNGGNVTYTINLNQYE